MRRLAPADRAWRLQGTPLNRSFMHLHLGFDATGLDDLELHHIVVNSWEGGVDTEQVRTVSAWSSRCPRVQLWNVS